MIIKDLQPLVGSIVKVKLKDEQEPLIGLVGPVKRFNYNPNIDEDIYPHAILNVIADWQNFNSVIETENELLFSISEIETLEILKETVPRE